MQPLCFKPKHTKLTWALALMYAAPWLFAVYQAIWSRANADWKLFWLLSATVWIMAGLLHMKGALVRGVTLRGGVTVELLLQKPETQGAHAPVCVAGDTLVFERQALELRYLANAPELMRMLADAAGRGELELVYEDSYAKPRWTAERNLLCLIVFALYMAAMLATRVRPLRLIGPAADAMLIGWAAMLPVLLLVKVVQYFRRRAREAETARKTIRGRVMR